jgi:hypothetical protein
MYHTGIYGAICPPNAMRMVHSDHQTTPSTLSWLRLMYSTTVVHLPYVYQLLAPRSRDLVRQLLARESFPCRLDDVHLVSRAGCLCGEVLETSGTREFEDEMLDAETETCEGLLAQN